MWSSIDDEKISRAASFITDWSRRRRCCEYRPVSRYRSPDDWGQVTSPVTEARVWTLNGEWNEAASAQRNKSTLSSWRDGNSLTSLSRDEFLGLGPVAVLRGANRALAPKAWFSPPQKKKKVCGLIGLNNCIMVITIQLMRLFRKTMTVSKIFSSTEAKMVHIWPNLR